MKLIKIKTDHFIIVDDSEFEEGDFVFNDYNKTIIKYSAGHGIGLCKKITHSTTTANLDVYGQTPVGLLLQEVKELIGEVDVKKIANNWALENADSTMESNSALNKGFIFGYNQCLEDNKDKKYTDEDMRKCWEACIAFNRPAGLDSGINYNVFIKNIQPKTEWEVEFIDGKLKLK